MKFEWFDGHEDIGVTAGASTPDFSIDAVVERIEEIDAAHVGRSLDCSLTRTPQDIECPVRVVLPFPLAPSALSHRASLAEEAGLAAR